MQQHCIIQIILNISALSFQALIVVVSYKVELKYDMDDMSVDKNGQSVECQ